MSARLSSQLDKFIESFSVLDGELRETLAVELDLGLLKPVHELTVGKPLSSTRGVDTNNPETSHDALSLSAVPRRERLGANTRLLGDFVELAPPATKPFDAFHQTPFAAEFWDA